MRSGSIARCAWMTGCCTPWTAPRPAAPGASPVVCCATVAVNWWPRCRRSRCCVSAMAVSGLPLRGWIFDLDGTLTIAQHDFAAIRRELGIPAEEDILEHLGRLPIAERDELNARLDDIELRLASQVEPAPGAAELIRELHGRGARLG